MARQTPKLSTLAVEEASAWLIDFEEGKTDLADRKEFDAWLRRSPEHVRAYLEISAVWEDGGALKKQANAGLEALIARAIAEQTIHRLDPSGASNVGAGELPRRMSRRFSLALAATVLLSLGLGISAWYATYRHSIYTTGTGEQRSLMLEDGSSIELDSRSRLKVRYSKTERSVELLEGQAFFSVAKNPSRPFIVTTGDTHVRAVGTQFDVYLKKSGTVVTVIEGKVAVNDAQPDPPEVGGPFTTTAHRASQVLSAGEQLTVTSVGVAAPKPVNLTTTMAWTERKLVFDSTPLLEVVEEFNRYNRQQLVIREAELSNTHVTGVFSSTDSSTMIEFLRKRFGVTMSRSGDVIEIFRRPDATDVAEQPHFRPSRVPF
jgi:transmembrane sensor